MTPRSSHLWRWRTRCSARCRRWCGARTRRSASRSVALLAGGHLLVEDLPGTGKTLLAKSLAAALGGSFGRVQCTPDLLPTDITGTSVFLPGTGAWDFRPGPLFANVVLVDEVNRASPRTQAALLEPMEERQVSIDGVTRPLPSPVLLHRHPEPLRAGRDVPAPREPARPVRPRASRWACPDRDAEREILRGEGGNEVYARITAVAEPVDVAAAIAAVRTVHVAPPLVEYVLDLAAATRSHPDVAVGASPRATVGLLAAARAHAVVAGRGYATPDDVQAVVVPAFAHRMSLGGAVDTAGATGVLRSIIEAVAVPRP